MPQYSTPERLLRELLLKKYIKPQQAVEAVKAFFPNADERKLINIIMDQKKYGRVYDFGKNPMKAQYRVAIFTGDSKLHDARVMTIAQIEEYLDKLRIPRLQNIVGAVVRRRYTVVISGLLNGTRKTVGIVPTSEEEMVALVDHFQNRYFPVKTNPQRRPLGAVKRPKGALFAGNPHSGRKRKKYSTDDIAEGWKYSKLKSEKWAEIKKLVRDGKSNKEISKAVGIPEPWLRHPIKMLKLDHAFWQNWPDEPPRKTKNNPRKLDTPYDMVAKHLVELFKESTGEQCYYDKTSYLPMNDTIKLVCNPVALNKVRKFMDRALKCLEANTIVEGEDDFRRWVAEHEPIPPLELITFTLEKV